MICKVYGTGGPQVKISKGQREPGNIWVPAEINRKLTKVSLTGREKSWKERSRRPRRGQGYVGLDGGGWGASSSHCPSPPSGTFVTRPQLCDAGLSFCPQVSLQCCCLRAALPLGGWRTLSFFWKELLLPGRTPLLPG